jgi:hypothetical protein
MLLFGCQAEIGAGPWTTADAEGLSGTNVALGRPVSTNSAWSANLAYATDGNLDTSKYVNLNGGVIYVQVDLGKDLPVNGVQLWHYYGDGRIYHDVIVRQSTTADFSSHAGC